MAMAISYYWHTADEICIGPAHQEEHIRHRWTGERKAWSLDKAISGKGGCLKRLRFYDIRTSSIDNYLIAPLNTNKTVTHLIIDNCRDPGWIFRRLQPFFQHNPSLQSFSVLGVNAENREIYWRRYCPELAQVMTACGSSSLVELNLCAVELCDAMAATVIKSLHALPGLAVVNLSSNFISTAGFEEMASLMGKTNSTLREVDLSDNEHSDKDIELLIEALKSNTSVESLLVDGFLRAEYQEHDWNSWIRCLCDKTSVNATSLGSNHTCRKISPFSKREYWRVYSHHWAGLDQKDLWECFREQLQLTWKDGPYGSPTRQMVAMSKVLRVHTHLDMTPFFKDSDKKDPDKLLKFLPHVVGWFDRASMLPPKLLAWAYGGGWDRWKGWGPRDRWDQSMGLDSYGLLERRLDAMYQFIRMVPEVVADRMHEWCERDSWSIGDEE